MLLDYDDYDDYEDYEDFCPPALLPDSKTFKTLAESLRTLDVSTSLWLEIIRLSDYQTMTTSTNNDYDKKTTNAVERQQQQLQHELLQPDSEEAAQGPRHTVIYGRVGTNSS